MLVTAANDRKLKDNIQKNLCFYRKKSKYTQKDLADLLHIGSTTVSGWERGAYTPDVDTLLLVCNLLDCSFGDMCGIDSASGDFTISADEKLLLSSYRKLNSEGKSRLNERAEELVTLGFSQSEKGDFEKMA